MQGNALIALSVILIAHIFYDNFRGKIGNNKTSNGYVRTSLCKVQHKNIDKDIGEMKDDIKEIMGDIKELLKK